MLSFALRKPSDPKAFPMACICGNAQGTLVDTLMDRNPIGRVMLCGRCCKEIARVRGYLPGERADELENAAALLATKEGDLVAAAEQIHDQVNHARSLEQRVAALVAELEDAHARERQATDRLEQMLASAEATRAALTAA